MKLTSKKLDKLKVILGDRFYTMTIKELVELSEGIDIND